MLNALITIGQQAPGCNNLDPGVWEVLQVRGLSAHLLRALRGLGAVRQALLLPAVRALHAARRLCRRVLQQRQMP
jgi:hypothetical protein